MKSGSESYDGRFLYSRKGAVAEIICPQTQRRDHVLHAVAGALDDREPGQTATRIFIKDYAAAVDPLVVP
ncbi:hypothetical protein [Streptomyces sp. SYSU K217416]